MLISDLYEELGVPLDADEKAIRAAYRRRSKATHPDAGGSPEATDVLPRLRDLRSR